MSTLKTLVPCALVAVVMVALSSVGVYAVGEDTVTVTPQTVSFSPLINFTGIFQTLLDKLAPLVAAALTIGLAIWGTKFIYNRARSMAR